MGIFTNIKAIFMAIGGAILFVFYMIFKNTKKENENLKKEVKAKDQQLKTQDIVHEQEKENIQMKEDFAETAKKIEEETKVEMKEDRDKILNAPDSQEYEVKL